MQLPESFISQLRQQLGESLEAFQDALDTPAPVSLHFNPFKTNLSKKENYEGVKWYSNGVYLPERPVFTLDPLFHGGQYYVQEASSMFLTEAVRQCVDLNKPLRVLDLAAAPGGKSTLLVSILHPESFILCNEVIRSRFKILEYNLIKWGTPNTYLSNHDSEDFSKLEGFFDLILLDAPCSGEGLFRKDEDAVGHWSEDHVNFCSLRQQRILKNTVPLLSPGGTLIYSTCTYNEQENESHGLWLEAEYGLEHYPLEIPETWNILHRNRGVQFYPHKVKGEGFYIACYKNNGGREISFRSKHTPRVNGLTAVEKTELSRWLVQPEEYDYFKDHHEGVRAILKSHAEIHQWVQKSLARYIPGTFLGTFKREQFIPSADLALSIMVSRDLPSVTLEKEQALRFLKKEPPDLAEIPDGWALVTYQNLPLGWIKGIQNRVNNYYPKEWRIRMNID